MKKIVKGIEIYEPEEGDLIICNDFIGLFKSIDEEDENDPWKYRYARFYVYVPLYMVANFVYPYVDYRMDLKHFYDNRYSLANRQQTEYFYKALRMCGIEIEFGDIKEGIETVKINKFLKPFDKIIYRDKEEKWCAGFFSHYRKEERNDFVVVIGQDMTTQPSYHHSEIYVYDESLDKYLGTDVKDIPNWRNLLEMMELKVRVSVDYLCPREIIDGYKGLLPELIIYQKTKDIGKQYSTKRNIIEKIFKYVPVNDKSEWYEKLIDRKLLDKQLLVFEVEKETEEIVGIYTKEDVKYNNYKNYIFATDKRKIGSFGRKIETLEGAY